MVKQFKPTIGKPNTFTFYMQNLNLWPTLWLYILVCVGLDQKPRRKVFLSHLSRRMGKPTICIGENKGADQLRSNCEADQRLCFRYTDSTIPLLSKFKISSLLPSSVTVQPDLCQTWSEPKLLVFSLTGSFQIG